MDGVVNGKFASIGMVKEQFLPQGFNQNTTFTPQSLIP